jgi:predicted anti-sigma-YlaC factor YlaD
MREAISARFDGEATGVTESELEAHVRECLSCWRFGRGLAPGSAYPVSAEVSDAAVLRVLRDIRATDGRRRGSVAQCLRIALLIAAAGQLGMAFPGLAHAEGHGLTHHAVRHMGSLALAMGLAFTLVAIRPSRARSMAPMVAVLLFSLVTSSAVDWTASRSAMLDDPTHLSEVVGSVAILVLAFSDRRRARRVLAL